MIILQNRKFSVNSIKSYYINIVSAYIAKYKYEHLVYKERK